MEIASAPHHPEQQKDAGVASRAFAGYCVVIHGHSGGLKFRNDPYGAPLDVSSRSIKLLLQNFLRHPSPENIHAFVTSATIAQNSGRLSQDDFSDLMTKYFDFLINDLHAEYSKLRREKVCDESFAAYQIACQKAEYARTLSVFTESQQHRLTCYKITFLMGAANFAGKLRQNTDQLNLAREALNLIESLPGDIIPAYADGCSLMKRPTLKTCNHIIARAEFYLRIYSPPKRSNFTPGNQW